MNGPGFQDMLMFAMYPHVLRLFGSTVGFFGPGRRGIAPHYTYQPPCTRGPGVTLSAVRASEP